MERKTQCRCFLQRSSGTTLAAIGLRENGAGWCYYIEAGREQGALPNYIFGMEIHVSQAKLVGIE